MSVRSRCWIPSLVTAALLAGCVTVGTQPPVAGDGAGPLPAPTARQSVRLPAENPPTPEGFARAPDAAALPPLPRRRPGFPRVTAQVFDGMTAARALAVFGKPVRAERMPGDPLAATAWFYERAGCRLEIAFHFSVADDALVAHAHEVSALDAGPPAAAEPLCLHALARDGVRVAQRAAAPSL